MTKIRHRFLATFVGEWFILRSEDFSYLLVPFGMSSDTVASCRLTTVTASSTEAFSVHERNWFIDRSTAGIQIVPFGSNGDSGSERVVD